MQIIGAYFEYAAQLFYHIRAQIEFLIFVAAYRPLIGMNITANSCCDSPFSALNPRILLPYIITLLKNIGEKGLKCGMVIANRQKHINIFSKQTTADSREN